MHWFRSITAIVVALIISSNHASASNDPITMLVMDPLAAPLSCPCVEGYAQRDYTKLADYLSEKLDREVRIGFGGSLKKAQDQAGSFSADIIIGKDSVVRYDVDKLGIEVKPIARLSGRDGQLSQTGFIVVCQDDPAQSIADLKDYRIFFGPEDSDEKHLAVINLLESNGIARVNPSTDDISGTCSDGAGKVVELGPTAKTAAVISSYAAPLLEGCGTIQPDDLRVLGETKPVPFVTAFVSQQLDDTTQAKIQDALITIIVSKRELLQALESRTGFVSLDNAYLESVKKK